VPETVDVVFDENNGKLVLIAGALAISDPLQDSTYGVSINAVKLRKVVQVTDRMRERKVFQYRNPVQFWFHDTK